jgi:hypothetical protein
LKELHATKGFRNALKMLDYNNIKHLMVDYLPPIFYGNVVFEFPLIGSSSRNSYAKLMIGMDKRHNGYAWIRTSTSHIKNDMDLTNRTASCEGHLHCDNHDCKYLNHGHCTSPMNEMEWNGFNIILFHAGC